MAEEYKSVHTGPDIDAAVTRALAGGPIDKALSEKLGLDGGTLRGNTLRIDNGNGAIVAGGSFVGLDSNAENGDIGRIQVYMLDGVYYASLATCYGGTWLVKNLATATPPTEYDLPVASGVSVIGGRKTTYSKDQFGRVIVRIQLSVDSQVNIWGIVGYLPAGYRPRAVESQMASPSVRLVIGTDGGISVTLANAPAGSDLQCAFIFDAGN